MNVERLAAQVRAVNNANRTAMEVHKKLTEIFRPYVGMKVCNQDGQFIKKIRDTLADCDLPSGVKMQVYRYISEYNILYICKACENIGDFGCLYHETSVYIAELKQGVLTKLYNDGETPQFRTDYTVDEIMEANTKYEQMKKEADLVIAPYHQFTLR